jgi:hypothetical protein
MVRFMADADLNGSIVGGCRRREPAIDFLSANDASLEGVSDPGVLGFGRCGGSDSRLTRFPNHTSAFCRFSPDSWLQPGLILVPQHMPIGEAIEELLLIWGASGAEEWRDRWQALPLQYRAR